MQISDEIRDGVTTLREKLLADRAVLDEALTAKRKEYRAIAQKISAAEAILGREPATPQSLPSLVLSAFDGTGPMTMGDVRDAIRGKAPARFLSTYNTALPNALARLVAKGDLSKDGRFYALAAIQAQGE